jgi:pimeloyl-ACP methyl ester carboxylesterase
VNAMYCDVRGSGPAIVLVPGLAATARFFAAAAAELAAEHTVATVELPGHGRSPGGDVPPSIDSAAAELKTALDEADIRGGTLVGWSLGASVAYRYLELHGSDRIAGLVSVEQTPKLVGDADWPHSVFGVLDQAGAAGLQERMAAEPAAVISDLVHSSFAAGSSPSLVDELIAEGNGCDRQAVAAMLADALAQDLRDSVRALSVPVLFLHGGKSVVYPTPVGQWLAASVPGARLEVFADSGHLPFIEERDRFVAIVHEFATSQAGIQAS